MMIFNWTQPIRVIFARMASGKTTFANKYDNVANIGHSEHKYLDYDRSLSEKNKGKFTQINPNFERDFFAVFESEYNRGNLIVINVEKFALDYLTERGIDFMFAYRDSWESIADLSRRRGNSDEFIEKKKKTYNDKMELMKNYDCVNLPIPDGKFLEDVLFEYEQNNKVNKNEQ